MKYVCWQHYNSWALFSKSNGPKGSWWRWQWPRPPRTRTTPSPSPWPSPPPPPPGTVLAGLLPFAVPPLRILFSKFVLTYKKHIQHRQEGQNQLWGQFEKTIRNENICIIVWQFVPTSVPSFSSALFSSPHAFVWTSPSALPPWDEQI